MEQERRPDLGSEDSQLVPVPADDAAQAASQTQFTAHGEIPDVEHHAHDVMPAPPSASEQAYGHHGSTKPKKGKTPKGAGPDPAGPTLTSPQTRSVAGVTIIAPVGTHATAIDRVAEIVGLEVGRNQYAQRRFAESRTTIVIIPAHTAMTDVPAFQSLRGQQTFDGRDWKGVRGSGGVQTADGAFAIGVAEENLVEIRGVKSGYSKGYSIAMHELAHALETKGMTDAQRKRLRTLFQNQQKQDRRDPTNHHDAFTDNYAASNEHEYFAQATNAFFNRNTGSYKEPGAPKVAKPVPNHNGPRWLYDNDPDMYQFLVEMYQTSHDAAGH